MRLFFAALCFAARVTSEDPEAAAQAVEALLESTEEALPDSTTINAGDAVRTDAATARRRSQKLKSLFGRARRGG